VARRFAQRLARHSLARIIRVLNDAAVLCLSAADRGGLSPRGCRIRGLCFHNTMTAETLSWEDNMKYIALLYGEPDAGPAPGTPSGCTGCCQMSRGHRAARAHRADQRLQRRAG
jgi:hypothetical protein